MRCQHLNVTLTEYLDAWSTWDFENGDLMDNGASGALLNGRIGVACHDCKKKWRFGMKRPKWVESRLLKIKEYLPEGTR